MDVRCHGESAHVSMGQDPHTIHTAAADIMALLSRLRLFPQARSQLCPAPPRVPPRGAQVSGTCCTQALIGHSMGGKVVMTMAEQFSARAATLPRPVQARSLLASLSAC